MQAHWETIFSGKPGPAHSWYQARPDTSLNLLDHCDLDADACIIDVGAGESLLVDHLLDKGFRCIHLLDISAVALDRTRLRLGQRAAMVTWEVKDVLAYRPAVKFDAWHDRAAFHFLTADKAVRAYARLVAEAVRPGGHLIIGTFTLTGPKKCSGLDIRQYDQAQLEKVFGAGFVLQEVLYETHHTPAGQAQDFIFCRFQRRHRDV